MSGYSNPYPTPVERSRRRALERLGPLSAMGLGAIGDIGSASFGTVSSETKTWETATDWDNATSEVDVIHPGAVIKLGVQFDSFENYSTGNAPPSPWENPASDGTVRSRSTPWGGQSVRYDQNPGTGTVVFRQQQFPADKYTTWYWAYTEDSGSQTGMKQDLRDDAGNLLLRTETNNPQVEVTGDSGKTTLINSPSPEYNEWRRFTITIDWTNDQFTVLWEDFTGSTSDQSGTFDLISGHNGNLDRVEHTASTGGGGNLGMDIDHVTGIFGTGNLVTATKTYSSSVTPDLDALDYTLNSQTITVDVIGSPGTASEEVVSQTLDGSSSYALSWSNSHTDFRVKPILETTDQTTTPTVNSISLKG